MPHAATHVALLTLRGGASSAGFDVGLAKTRLDGLAYTTVTALMLNAAIRLYSMTPTKLENVPHGEAAKAVKFVSQLSVSVSFNIICQDSVSIFGYKFILEQQPQNTIPYPELHLYSIKLLCHNYILLDVHLFKNSIRFGTAKRICNLL